jgi:hypothetical protein
MAICVFGASIEHPSEEICREAIAAGTRDDRGELFEIISLRSLQNVSNNTTVHGFEDTFLEVEGSEFRVWHRPEGRIKWIRGKYGKPKGELAKTPFNCAKLARMYYDRVFKIEDPTIDAEIKAMADKILADMTPEEREQNKYRIEQMYTSQGGGPLLNHQGKAINQVESDAKEVELRKREADLNRREAEINAKQRHLSGTVTRKIELGGSVTKHTHIELMEKKVFELRKVARVEFGMQPALDSKKIELVDAILEEQTKREESVNKQMKEEPLAVTG